MKKNRVNIIIFVFIALVLILRKPLLNTFEIFGLFAPTQSYVENMYYKNESNFITINAFIQEMVGTDEMRIDLYDSINRVELYKRNNAGGYDNVTIYITDEKIISILEKLKEGGLIRIQKEYNYTDFQVWGSLGGSVSLIFSQNEYPDISQINAKEKFVNKLSISDWYYAKIIYE